MTNVCALDLGGTTVKGRVRGADGSERTWSMPAPRSEPELARIVAGIAEPLASLAIAVPGVVSPDGRRLIGVHGKYAGLRDIDLVELAAGPAGVAAERVVIENDARAALVGELGGGGAAEGCRSAALIVLGTGIGTAAVCDGVMLRGATGHAGILGGHVSIERDGERCPCGNIGCAETVGASWALPVRARRHPGYEASPLAATPDFGFREVLSAAREGDPCGRSLLEGCLDAWATVTVTLCHGVDPDVVVFSGGPMNAAPDILPTLETMVRDRLWGGMPRPRFRSAADPTHSVIKGLLALASARHHEETA